MCEWNKFDVRDPGLWRGVEGTRQHSVGKSGIEGRRWAAPLFNLAIMI